MTSNQSTSTRSSVLVVILVFGILFVLFALSGAFSQQNPVSSNGMINGTITRSPTQPICHTEQPCSGPAAGVSVTVSSSGGEHTYNTTTDTSGNYLIQVPIGQYSVSVHSDGIPSIRNYTQLVNVTQGQTVSANFQLDTGIR